MNFFSFFARPFFFLLMLYQLWIAFKKFLLPSLQEIIKKQEEEDKMLLEKGESLSSRMVQEEKQLTLIAKESSAVESFFAQWHQRKKEKENDLLREHKERAHNIQKQKEIWQKERAHKKCLEKVVPQVLEKVKQELQQKALQCKSISSFLAHMHERIKRDT